MASEVPALQASTFLKACRRERTAFTPIWLLRQAGRYMPEYRAVRSKVGFLELVKSPELCAEVTLTAREVLGVDAAILFADLLPILEPMGAKLEFMKGEGPVIHNPIRGREDYARYREADVEGSLSFVFQSVARVRRDLPAGIPLIGFAGAPFTLASYLIEGGGSRDFSHTKTLMYSDPGLWHELLGRIVRALIPYLAGQIRAGAQAVQLFDSWVGALGPSDYREFVLPHSKAVLDALPREVPVIHFGTSCAALLPGIKAAGGDVIGLDFRVDLEDAWASLGSDVAVQGNLDPCLLFAPFDRVREGALAILRKARNRPGHIFNLGHGILPGTPVENVKALVDLVHEASADPGRFGISE